MPIVLGRGSTGGGGSGGAPTGPAGGDLGGTYPNPTISDQGSDSGLVLTSDGAGGTAFVRPPGLELAYAQFTSNVTVSSASAATPDDVVSAGALTFDGSTRVCIEFFSPQVLVGATAGSAVVLALWDASTELARFATAQLANINVPVAARRFVTPSNGSHTYRVRAWRSNSNGAVVGGAGTGGEPIAVPGFIRITIA